MTGSNGTRNAHRAYVDRPRIDLFVRKLSELSRMRCARCERFKTTFGVIMKIIRSIIPEPNIYGFITGFRAIGRVVNSAKPIQAKPRKRLTKVCAVCKISFPVRPYRAKTMRFCGQPCRSADTRARNRAAARGKK